MRVTDRNDLNLLAALQDGLPLMTRPYAALGDAVGLDEDEVIRRLRRLIDSGVIRRFGVIVRHRQLGYRANAMVVWDVPDDEVADVGERMAALAHVTLCYRRPRRAPDWPYNLFCMIHGKDRARVLAQVEETARACGLEGTAHETLFSGRCFKQRGARYGERLESVA